MATDEVENFVRKFKMLRDSGYDATLTLESRLGEVSVTLNCKVGRTSPPPTTPLASSSPRYRSPSYFRRQVRRKAAAEQQSSRIFIDMPPSDLKADEVLIINDADGDSADPPIDAEEALTKAEKPSVTAAEPDRLDVAESMNAEEASLDREEAERDRLVQEVIVYAVPPTDIRKRKQTVDEVESEIKDRFSSIGVQVKAIRHRMDKGCYESSLVSIDPPVNLKTIWGRRLGLQNCALIEFKPSNAK